jgi:hypothetical protein
MRGRTYVERERLENGHGTGYKRVDIVQVTCQARENCATLALVRQATHCGLTMLCWRVVERPTANAKEDLERGVLLFQCRRPRPEVQVARCHLDDFVRARDESECKVDVRECVRSDLFRRVRLARSTKVC